MNNLHFIQHLLANNPRFSNGAPDYLLAQPETVMTYYAEAIENAAENDPPLAWALLHAVFSNYSAEHAKDIAYTLRPDMLRGLITTPLYTTHAYTEDDYYLVATMYFLALKHTIKNDHGLYLFPAVEWVFSEVLDTALTLDTQKMPRPQMAQALFGPAWCALYGDVLEEGPAAIIQHIWLARPPLLFLQDRKPGYSGTALPSDIVVN